MQRLGAASPERLDRWAERVLDGGIHSRRLVGLIHFTPSHIYLPTPSSSAFLPAPQMGLCSADIARRTDPIVEKSKYGSGLPTDPCNAARTKTESRKTLAFRKIKFSAVFFVKQGRKRKLTQVLKPAHIKYINALRLP